MPAREITWPYVAEWLRPSRSYWLATTAMDGSPHVTPVWAVVVEDVLFMYSDRTTVKARNIAHDDRVSLNLPDGEDVVIVRGRLTDLGTPLTRPDVVAAIVAKYTQPIDLSSLPSEDPNSDEVLWALEPTRALVWRLDDWDGSYARWSAPPARRP